MINRLTKPRSERLFSLSRDALSRTQNAFTASTDSSPLKHSDDRTTWDARDELNNWDDDGGLPAATSQATHDETKI